MPTQPRPLLLLPGALARWPGWALALAYVPAFLLLDWVSFIRPQHGLNITPWGPQPALAIVLLMFKPRAVGLVWLSLLAAEVLVRGLPRDWFVTAGATAALALAYAAMARAMVLHLRATPVLAARGELLRFIGITTIGALLSGAVYVGTYALAGLGPQGPFLAAWMRYWIGDTVGLLVALPICLALTDPQRRLQLWLTLRDVQWWLIAASVPLLMWAVFAVEARDRFKFVYLLLLPVAWASARLGLAGAVLASALTQVALIAAMETVPGQDIVVFELQVFMAAIAIMGLLLGVVTDERERAAAELKGSLRLAAAGQMAAALAHELSQPLTALGSYAEAARLIAASPGTPAQARLDSLTAVSERMAQDALRASEVVKRLRGFFRTGHTQLQQVDMQQLMAQALAQHRSRAEALGVRWPVPVPAPPAMAWVDSVQIEVVLRNLLANALDACAGRANAAVSTRLEVHDPMLHIEVRDNGPGIDRARLQALFEPGHSDKPGGMGVGLSICRAIVEAHGGVLWVEPGAGGIFCFNLPLGSHARDDSAHPR